MIWITFGWISGWGQVKSGQSRSNFEVGLLKQNWYLCHLVFDGEFNDGIFIFVDCLELPKIAIQNFDKHCFRDFCGNLGTTNWRFASIFSMGIANISKYVFRFSENLKKVFPKNRFFDNFGTKISKFWKSDLAIL